MMAMLKRDTILIFICSMLTLLGIGCTNDSTQIEGFSAEISTIEAKAEGGEYAVAIRSAKEWTAIADAPWVMISPANGRGEVKCTIKIDSTLVNDVRTTDIRFSSAGEILQSVAVSQEGFARSVKPEMQEYRVNASATRANRWFTIDLMANVEFDVTAEYDDGVTWLDIDDYTLNLDRGARPRATSLKVEWKMNSEPKERVATLHISARDGSALSSPTTITIRQSAAPLIEDNRQGDSLAVITIFEKLECWSNSGISTTESMERWESVRLWEDTDKALPNPAAVGRVRDLDLSYFNTEEGIPAEIRHLKYLETLSLFGNVNTMLKSIDMGEEVCSLQYLKALRVAAFGLVSLPDNFILLGDSLEELDINSNNLTSIPEVLTPENFPQLRSLDLSGNRRSNINDLRTESSYDDGIGIHTNATTEDGIRRLLLWENLEELSLSYNYIEGQLPDFRVGEDGVRAYTKSDVAERGDTLNWAVESGLPRILPNVRSLKINLNFFTGDIPDWLLYHPRLMEWAPEILIFTQLEHAIDSEGNNAGFSNEPTSREYYFQKYPLMRGRFEFNDEIE